MAHQPGRHFLQIPGPTNVPADVLAAIAKPTIDHRSAEFAGLAFEVLDGLKTVFATRQPVVVYPASGTGAWEAALVNTLAPGDRVVMFETGWFSTLWERLARRLSLRTTLIRSDWRSGVDTGEIESLLAEDKAHAVKAVAVVHNETSTGVASNVAAVRAALDNAGHPALLLVDTISSLASIPYEHDQWDVDVTVGCSQKGLMLPPGLSFNAVSKKALDASQRATIAHGYWDWAEILAANQKGFFPYTPATNLLQGLKVALRQLQEEGLTAVFARHARAAAATRAAAAHWGLELQCRDAECFSASLTAIRVPDGKSADAVRAAAFDSNMSLGSGLGLLADKVFRIGHLGDFNDLTLLGALAGVEMALTAADIEHRPGGVEAAIAALAAGRPTPSRPASSCQPVSMQNEQRRA